MGVNIPTEKIRDDTTVRFISGSDYIHIGTSVTTHHMVRRPNRGDNFVVSWMLEGDGLYTEESATYSLSPESVCIRRPDRDYILELPAKRGVRLFIDMPVAMYRAILLFLPELSGIAPVRVQPFSRELYAEFHNLHDAVRRTEQTELFTLFPQIVRYVGRIVGIDDAREMNRLNFARSLIDDVMANLPLEDIAERIGMSYHRFRRMFTAEFGTSPGKYRTKRRIEVACKLLGQGESVMKVAAAVGYGDIYTFTHRFTAEMGVPPSTYAESSDARSAVAECQESSR